MKNRQHLKAVVWPHPPTTVVPYHRYVIVGMLVTEQPIPSFDGKNKRGISEFLVDGQVFGLVDLLDFVHKGTPNINYGDANNWLCSLDIASILEDEKDK